MATGTPLVDPAAQRDIVSEAYNYLYNLASPFLLKLFSSFQTQPFLATIQILVTLTILTRIATTIASWLGTSTQKRDDDTPQPVSTLPYWLPFLGHWLQFATHGQLWLRNAALDAQSGVVGLMMLGRKVNIVVGLELASELSKLSEERLDSEIFKLKQRSRFFGARRQGSGTSRLLDQTITELRSSSEWLIRMARLLEQNGPNFVTGTKSLVDQEMWERGATVEISDREGHDVCFANLQILVRDFSSQITVTALLGSAFVQANGEFVANFANFAREYHRFMVGWPYWIMPGLGPPAGAREKCLRALEDFVREVQGADENKSGPSAAYDDLSDVNSAVWMLIEQASKSHGDARPANDSRDIACMLLEIIWQLMWYSNAVTFWVLLRLSSKAASKSLENCRKELRSLLHVAVPERFNMAFSEPPKLKYNEAMIQALQKDMTKMPNLAALIFEVLRLETEIDHWYVAKDVVVLSEHVEVFAGNKTAPDEMPNTEIRTDAKTARKRHFIPPGERIYEASGAFNRDEKIWGADAADFSPERWLSRSTAVRMNNTKEEAKAIAMNSLQEQARNLGVEPVMLLVTAILSLFDIKAAREQDEIRHPGTHVVACVGLSKRNTRARVIRRDLEKEAEKNGKIE